MPAAHRLGDLCSGHTCWPPRVNVEASPNVYVNGIKLHRKGDGWASHCCAGQCHASVLAEGSPTVFANFKEAARIGDPVACGSTAATGSSNVFIGDGPVSPVVDGISIPENPYRYSHALPTIETAGKDAVIDEPSHLHLIQNSLPYPDDHTQLIDRVVLSSVVPAISFIPVSYTPLSAIDYSYQLSNNFQLRDLSTNSLFSNKIEPQLGLTFNDIINNLKVLSTNVLEPIYAHDPNFSIISGFRKEVDGDGQHEKGEAVDIQWINENNDYQYEMAEWIRDNVLFDQLIIGQGNRAWIHISLKKRGVQRRKILSLYNENFETGFVRYFVVTYLTGSMFTNEPIFPTAILTLYLTPTKFTNTSTFGTHTIENVAVPGTLQPALYINPDTFGSHTLTGGVTTLLPTKYTNTSTFGTHTLTGGTVTLQPTKYNNTNTFGTHTLTGGASDPVAISYLDTQTDGGATNQTFTFASFGSATADRLLLAVITTYAENGYTTLSSVTIGGVSATLLFNPTTEGASFEPYLGMAIAAVPSGTSGDVDITWAADPGSRNSDCSLFRIENGSITPFNSDYQHIEDDGVTTFLTGTIDCPADGAVVGGWVGADRTVTWSDLNESIDTSSDGAQQHSAAFEEFASTQTNLSVTVTATSAPVTAKLYLVSFEPL